MKHKAKLINVDTNDEFECEVEQHGSSLFLTGIKNTWKYQLVFETLLKIDESANTDNSLRKYDPRYSPRKKGGGYEFL